MPAAIKSLAAHLGEGDPEAWRAALRVFELSYGKPAETVEVDLEHVDPLHVGEMSPAERRVLLARVLDLHPHLIELVPAHARGLAELAEGHPLGHCARLVAVTPAWRPKKLERQLRAIRSHRVDS